MKTKYSFFFTSALALVFVTLFSPSSTKSLDEIFSAWQAGNNLPYQLANHASFTYSNRIYAINGSAQTGASKKSVISSSINQDGSLTSWSNINADTPDALILHASAIKENKIYVLGGKVEPLGIGNSVDYVWVGNLNIDGGISGWEALNPLPKRLSKSKAVIINNRIYFVGGATWTNGSGPVISDSVYFASINPDGTIGNWTATTSLPTPLSGHGLIEASGKIITLGGSTNPGETPINKTYSAPVNADGTLGNWTVGPNLPVGLRDGGAVKIGAYTVYVGGYSGQFSNKVYYSAIDNNGNLGTWIQSVNNLPTGHCCGSLAAWHDRLYLSGGHNGANYINSVFTSSLSTNLPDLSVPDIKQYSSPWNDDIYDTANLWSSNPTIERWGCALTSATMVLKYFGHNINPDTLNNWLKAQADGYIRNGLLNWLAVSRYTRLHDSPTSPILEYRRLGNSQTDLIAELTAGRPAILAEPGHFLVAKSQTIGSFGINDPAYTTKPTLASYGNTYANLGSYRPTHTDLSYIMLVADAGINLAAFDFANNPVGQTSLELPLVDDIGNSATSGTPLKIFLLPIPPTGSYRIELSGPSRAYQLDSYLYNPQGDAVKSVYKGLIAPSQTDIVIVNIGPNSTSTPQVTIDSLLIDLEDANNAGKISRPQIYQALKTTLLSAKLLIQKGLNASAKKVLNSTLVTLKTSTPRFIDLATSQILQENTQLLINKL